MAKNPLLRLFGDELQNRLQDATQQALPDSSAITDGRLIEVTASGNVAHKLGRKWQGCFAVKGAPITSASGGDDTLFVNVTLSVPGTVTVWVF